MSLARWVAEQRSMPKALAGIDSGTTIDDFEIFLDNLPRKYPVKWIEE